MSESAPHLPHAAAIESVGRGGFRFGGMSHRGSILCLPTGVWAWAPKCAAEIDAASLARVFVLGQLRLLLIGTGRTSEMVSADIRKECSERNITVEIMRTGDAANTYNILLGENREAAAALIAPE